MFPRVPSRGKPEVHQTAGIDEVGPEADESQGELVAVDRVHEDLHLHVAHHQVDAQVLLDHGVDRLPGLVDRPDVAPDPHLHAREALAVRVSRFGQQFASEGRVVPLDGFQGFRRFRREAGRQHRVGGDRESMQRGFAHGVPVDGVAEGLAHLQVVEGRVVRVHGEVVGREIRIGMQLPAQPWIGLDPGEFGVVRYEAEIHLVGLVGREQGRWRRRVVQLGNQRLQVGPRGAVVPGVGLEHDPVRLGPLRQVEGPARDGGLRARGPGVAVLLHRLAGGNPAVHHQIGHVGTGFVRLDEKGIVVNRVDAQRVERQFPSHDAAPVLDRTVIPLHVVGVFRIGPASQRKHVVVGGQRLAVGELEIVPKVEIPAQPVVGGLPAVRCRRDQVEVLVETDQRFGDDPVAVGPLVDRAEPLHVGVVQLKRADVLLRGRRRVGRQFDACGVDVPGR